MEKVRSAKDSKEVENIELDGVDTKDYPDFTDAFVSSAQWVDTGKELSEAELEEFKDSFPELINEMAFQHYI